MCRPSCQTYQKTLVEFAPRAPCLRQVAGSTTPRSPFAAAAAAPAVTPGRIVPSTAPKAPGGLLSRLCSCGRPAAGGGGDEGHEEGGSGRGGREAAAAHAASALPASSTPAQSVSVRAGPHAAYDGVTAWCGGGRQRWRGQRLPPVKRVPVMKASAM